MQIDLIADEVGKLFFELAQNNENSAARATLIHELKIQANFYIGKEPRVTRLLAETMTTIGTLSEDKHNFGIGKLALGDAYRYLGKPELAFQAYNAAAEAFKAISNRVGWARTRIGLLLAEHDAGHSNINERLREAAEARRIFFEYHETDLLVMSSLNLAYFHIQRFELNPARESLQLGLELVGTAPSVGRAKLLRNLGFVLAMSGAIALAKAKYAEAEQLFVELDQPQELASLRVSMAQLVSRDGHYLEALTLIQQCKDNLSQSEAVVAQQLEALAYHFLGANEKASRLMRSLLRQRQSLNERQLANIRTYSVDIEAALGNYSIAQNLIKEAQQFFKNVGGQQHLFELAVRHALILLKINQPQQAADEVSHAMLSEEIDVQARGYYVLSKVALASGQHDVAMQMGVQGYKCARAFGEAGLISSTQLQLGHIREVQGYIDKALLHYRYAHARILALQTQLNFDVRAGFLERNQEALHSILHLYIQAGKADVAWETLEELKSRVLWQYLAAPHGERQNTAVNIDGQAPQYAELQQRYRWLVTLVDSKDWSVIGHEQTLAEMREIEQELYAARESRRLRTTQLTASTQITSLQEVIKHVPLDSALIEYYIDQDAIYAFIMTSSAPIQMVCCSEGFDSLLRSINALSEQINRALAVGSKRAKKYFFESTIDCLATLYVLLLERLEPYIRDYTTLTVIPFGVLHVVPFHLLYSNGSYLLERKNVSILPAAGLLLQEDVQRPNGILALAYGGKDDDAYQIHQVAHHLVEMFEGEFYGGIEAVSSLLQHDPRQILHIAAHGLFNLHQPHLATLRFADRPVYADELLNYDLSYELIVLSACSAGLAKASGGDELIGLGRGFLYAGARSLVTSLWDVDDSTTAHILQRFYTELKEGSHKSNALRIAQLSLLCGDTPMHPAYAGAFQLIGSDSPLSKQHLDEEIL